MKVNSDGYPVAWAEDGIVVVNFGILSGREATQAELDRLAYALRRAGAGTEMTISAVRRQDYGQGFEGVVTRSTSRLTVLLLRGCRCVASGL